MKQLVLIVDDNPLNAKLVRLLLAGEGYEIRTAGDAEDAIRTLLDFLPNLILMDIQMPGMDGLQLTRLLKLDPRTRQIIVVALTAFAMKGDEEKARQAGCDGYITKPIDTRTIAAAVRGYLEAEKQRAANEPGIALSSDILMELRRSLAVEGGEQIRRLIESARNGPMPEELGGVLHRWAGTGATLGLPELTDQARDLQALLRNFPVQHDQLFTGLNKIEELFSHVLSSQPA
jgi:two-component system cell cycle response regulator DivK